MGSAMARRRPRHRLRACDAHTDASVIVNCGRGDPRDDLAGRDSPLPPNRRIINTTLDKATGGKYHDKHEDEDLPKRKTRIAAVAAIALVTLSLAGVVVQTQKRMDLVDGSDGWTTAYQRPGKTELVSVATNGSSIEPIGERTYKKTIAISGDGRYVAYSVWSGYRTGPLTSIIVRSAWPSRHRSHLTAHSAMENRGPRR